MELKAGNVDVMMNMGFNEQRAEHFHYISPHTNETTVLLTRKDMNIEIHSLNYFKKFPLKIGYEAGNIYDEICTKKFHEDQDFRNVFQAVVSGDYTEMAFLGQLSGKLTLLENAKYALKNIPKYNEQMKIHPLIVSKLPTFFAFSEKSVSQEKMLLLHDANIRAISKGLYESVKDRWE